MALASAVSLIRPWLTRKWPRYSSGRVEAVATIWPSRKKIFFSTLSVLISSVPVLRLWESHWSSSSSCMVRRFPTMPMMTRADYRSLRIAGTECGTVALRTACS